MTYMFDGKQYIAVAAGPTILAFGISDGPSSSSRAIVRHQQRQRERDPDERDSVEPPDVTVALPGDQRAAAVAVDHLRGQDRECPHEPCGTPEKERRERQIDRHEHDMPPRGIAGRISGPANTGTASAAR